MAKIVLSTLNAKYIHCAFGLRYLYANLEELQSESKILEFNINQRPIEIVENILEEKPKILGLGVYIWNTVQTLEVIKLIKTIAPEIIIVVGGPEVSYEFDKQEIVQISDYCITGEADITFRETCRTLIAGEKPAYKIIKSPLPKPEELKSPYPYYSEKDIEHRIVYVEASRGCPFSCEFCLSSLDIPVRQFDLEPFLAEMQSLYDRGARQFKFVDRTFNLHLKTSQTILQFFLDRMEPGLFVHFEMVPDRLPDGLRQIIEKFPDGSLQFEVGIQSFNPEVNKLISRKQNFEKIAENIKFLRENTGVHIHADLIAGLPGEDLDSFAKGFDTLIGHNPQEIQVGILKRLKGTPIVRHTEEWQMKYNPSPAYEILSNSLIDFATMQRISRFSRYWDLFANSGNFLTSLPLLWANSKSPFAEFMRLSDWLFAKVGQRSGIALEKLRNYIKQYALEFHVENSANIIKAVDEDSERIALKRKLEKQVVNSSSTSQPLDIKTLPTRQLKHITIN